MKQKISLAISLVLIFTLFSCSNDKTQVSSNTTTTEVSQTSKTPEQKQDTKPLDTKKEPDEKEEGRGDIIEEVVFTLVADFSNGSSDGETKLKEIPAPPKKEMPASNALIVNYLADELSDWTGLKFSINDVIFEDNFVTVDWASDSTLITGLGKQTQNKEFHFYDAVSLNWFMMDSLAMTLKQNFDISEVYYSYGYGAVTFTNPEDMEAQGLEKLPPDQPYEGSAFFVSHAGNK